MRDPPPERILSDRRTFPDFTRTGFREARSKGPLLRSSAAVFIERKPTALRAANLLKHEATEYKNHQSQHDYRNQHPFGHDYPLRRLRSLCRGGCGSAEPARAGFCSGSAALRRERISIQTSRAIEMAVNPPTRKCEASMVLFSFSVFSTAGRDWTSSAPVRG